MAKERYFPDEVLENIFAHLDPQTKVSASSVSKGWMKIFTENPDLMEDVCVYFVAFSLKNAFTLFDDMSRKFSTFYFSGATIDENCFNFLEKFGPQLRSLTFDRCAVRADLSDRKLQNCNQLLKLKVWGCNALSIFSEIPTLTSLHFEINKTYFERDLAQLQLITPLTLTDFGMVDLGERDAEFLKSFYPDVQDFIKTRKYSLESLDFTGTVFLDSDMERLSEIEGLRLRRFKVSSHFMKDSTIGAFCSKQRWIVALELGDHISPRDSKPARRDCSSIRDANVVAICTALPNLEELTLSCCTRINKSVTTIFQLRQLRRLNLIRCTNIKPSSFQNALAGLACKDLKFLNLYESLIDPPTLSQLLASLPKLNEIILSRGHYLDSTWVECPKFRTRHRGLGYKFERQTN